MRVVRAGLLATLIGAATLAAIWTPIAQRYWVVTPALDAALAQAHRSAPADAVLAAISEQSLMSDNPITGTRTIALADRFLAGRLEYPLMGGIDITPGFAPADLAAGSDVVQFLSAGLIGPDWLLRAYEITGEERYFAAAHRYVLGFIAFEATRWLPHASIWATNALATRAGVLVRFWRLYRQRSDFDAQVAVGLLQHASRVGELLARPAAFVGVSNHGVMQNIGLLQIATAFAQLPESERFARIALSRLAEQMPFYVSDEGVVLEHSAGYHFSGVRLLAYIRELNALRGEPMPTEWAVKQDRALAFFRLLERPDGTLPMFGNTLSMPWTLPDKGLGPQPVSTPAHAGAPTGALHPVSGYAAWWDTARAPNGGSVLTQTVVPWSNFSGHAHKLADEMSLLLWADGHSWITNVGYSPYHGALAAKAADWTGSTAPHLIGERPQAARETRLRASLDADGLRALDLERTNADGTRVRRQIVAGGGRWWIVLDAADAGNTATLCTQWTTYPGTHVTARPVSAASAGNAITPGTAFRLTREGSSRALALQIATGGHGKVEQLEASTEPYAGWAVVDRRPVPTQSLRSTARAQDWILSVFVLDAAATEARGALLRTATVSAPEQWRVTLDIDGQPLTVAREAMTLTHTGQAFTLRAGRDVTAERTAIATAFNAVRDKYPRVRDLLDYRWRATLATIAGWMAVLLIAALPVARSVVRLQRVVDTSLLLLYAGACSALVLVYLR